jgi:hypothetical protein
MAIKYKFAYFYGRLVMHCLLEATQSSLKYFSAIQFLHYFYNTGAVEWKVAMFFNQRNHSDFVIAFLYQSGVQ